MRRWVDRATQLVRRLRLEMAGRKSVKRTNLTHEIPGPRALVSLQQESFEFESSLPLVGGKLAVRAMLTTGSPLSQVIITLVLVVLGCACVATLAVVGLPMWISAPSMLLPFALFGVLRYKKGPHAGQ